MRASSLEAPLALAAILSVGVFWMAALTIAGQNMPGLQVAPALLVVAAGGLALAFMAIRGSAPALIVLLVLAAFGLGISFRVRDYGDTGIDLQNGIKLLVWLLIPLLALVHLKRMLPFLRQPVVILAAGFAVIAMASALWSQTPIYTGASALGLLSYLLLACLVISVLGEEATLRVLLFSLLAFALTALVAIMLLPGMAWLVPSGYIGAERLQGLSGHPNVLGEQMAVMITLAAICRRQGFINRWTFVICIGLGLLILEATGSRTMLAAAFLAWLIVALRQKGMLKIVAIGVASLAAAFTFVLAMGMDPIPPVLLSSFSRSGSTWELITLTGRTELWTIALELLGERPFLGWGFNGTEALFVANVGRAFYGDPVNAHSLYMQTLVSLGIIGSLPLFALLVLFLVRAVVDPDPARDHIMLLVLIIGIAEVAIAATPSALTLVFCVFIAREAARTIPQPSVETGCMDHGSLRTETS